MPTRLDYIVFSLVALVLFLVGCGLSLIIHFGGQVVDRCEETGNVAYITGFWDDDGFYIVTCTPPTTTAPPFGG